MAALCLVLANGVFAQPSLIDRKIAPAALRSDFLLLKDTLQKIYPSLYRFRSKKEINKMFDSCYSSIRDSMSTASFYLLASYTVAYLEDGHANCRLPGAVVKDYITNVKVFPAMVSFINNKAFIYCCKQNNALTGAEILSVDGMPMSVIVQKIFTYICSDGSIESRKNWELPDNFPLLFNFIYGEKDNYKVGYRTPGGVIGTALLEADYVRNFICEPPSIFHRPAKYLSLSYTANNSAILTIKTFFNGYLQQTRENFSQFLDSAFTDLENKGVTKLLIDIRRNQGGNDENGEILYSYLTKKPFTFYALRQTVNKKFSSRELSTLGEQQPKPNNFTGMIFVLMDGRSFSASADFAAIAKSNNRAVFIGEECGGGYYGNTSGDDISLNLPNTNISCRITLVKYISAVKTVKQKDRGVMPDYPSYITIQDLINGKDSQLDYALTILAAAK